MLEFIMLTISFTVAILLASCIAVIIAMRPKVINWYMKKVMKMTADMQEAFEEELMKDL